VLIAAAAAEQSVAGAALHGLQAAGLGRNGSVPRAESTTCGLVARGAKFRHTSFQTDQPRSRRPGHALESAGVMRLARAGRGQRLGARNPGNSASRRKPRWTTRNFVGQRKPRSLYVTIRDPPAGKEGGKFASRSRSLILADIVLNPRLARLRPPWSAGRRRSSALTIDSPGVAQPEVEAGRGAMPVRLQGPSRAGSRKTSRSARTGP